MDLPAICADNIKSPNTKKLAPELVAAVAGTGQVVGFAFYWVPNPSDSQGNPHHSLELKVRSDGDATPADIYPIPHPSGVVKAGDHDRAFDAKIAAQLHTISN